MKKMPVLSILLLFNLVTHCSEESLSDPVETPFDFDTFFENEHFRWLTLAPTPPQNDADLLDLSNLANLAILDRRNENNFTQCSICHKNIDNTTFKRHMAAHSSRKIITRHKCQVGCPYRASSLDDLAEHHDKEHGKGKKILHSGKWIGRSTLQKRRRRGPGIATLQSGPPKERCIICSLDFLRYSKHSQTHTGTNIACDICSYITDSHQTMQRHRTEIHNVNTTHYCKCTKCDGKFIPKSTYFKHQ